MQVSVIHLSPAGDGEKSRRGGFTLIEIMVVVAIIIVLAGILLAVGSAVLRSASNNATKNTLTSLDNAMTLWLKDHPEPGVGIAPNTKDWVRALSTISETSKLLEKLKSRGTGIDREILDGYGGPIYYIPSNFDMATSTTAVPVFNPALHTPGRFVSFGADRKPDSVALGAAANANSGDDMYSNGASVGP